jgi:hypothetical protein
MPDDTKPAHILEIPESLGRDIDKARADPSRPAIPIESFMSDQALETAEQMTRAAEPVHAEDLRPISPAQAAARTRFDGETMPKAPVTRRVIPAPFQRHRINLTLPWEPKRQWGLCRAEDVREGDTVVDLGLVVSREYRMVRETVAGVKNVAIGFDIVLTGKGGITRTFGAADQVRAFRQEA